MPDSPPRRQAFSGRALVLANLHARKTRRLLQSALDRLRADGLELSVASPRNLSLCSDRIRDCRDEVDLVIVAGGDGTLNAAVDGLVESGLPLGLLPLGTANDLARTLGIPADLEVACEIIRAGHKRQIDVGRVNDKHFFNVASLGLSVGITRELTKDVKRRWGVLAYWIAAARVLWRARPFRAEIRGNGDARVVRTVQITVGNGRFYGGGMRVADDAAIDDQRLDLYSLQVEHWWQMLGLLKALRTGSLANRPYVLTLTGREFEIHTRRPRRINTDGELTVSTPALFRLVPKAVTVFVPEPEATVG
jgi:YegS/Rv2252/BmrU family lipid kinase